MKNDIEEVWIDADTCYHMRITRDPEDGVSTGQCIEIPAAIAQGDSGAELWENMIDAIKMCLEHQGEEGTK